MSLQPLLLRLGLPAACALVFAGAGGIGSMAWFHFGDPRETCASCHEMGGVHSEWSQSAHRTLHCRHCHGGSLTLDLHAVEAHLNRVFQHVAGEVPVAVRLAERDVLRAHAACQACHPQSFADWQASRHAATYGRIFLDPEHNRAEQPADDCLRCHGMFFGGSVDDLIAPLDKSGPWSLLDPTKAAQPAIPCLACHQIHTTSDLEQAAKAHFFDNREGVFFAATELPAPAFEQEGRPVRISPDPRQRLCTQCHAPSQALAHPPGSSDDRTPLGVHEGLSCLDCHHPHSNSARASCATCHPAQSNCGLDVEKMDTTFLDKASWHDVHTVACRDCHAEGVPAARPRAVVAP